MVKIGTPLTKVAKKALLCGSGELGKEVAMELQRYGVEVIALDRYPDAPAMQVAHRSYVLSMLDGDKLREIIEKEKPDLIIPEVEAIATPTLVQLEKEGYHVIPTANATFLTMNRKGIRQLAHETLGLPGFAVVTIHLMMANRIKERSAPGVTDGEQRNLVIELHEAFHDDLAGTGPAAFAPDLMLSREQMATMLCRAIKKYKFSDWTLATDGDYYLGGSGGQRFADDADISEWARDSVYFMSSVGIIKGVDATRFAPKNTTDAQEAEGYATATREQAILLANRIFKTRDMF